MKPIQPSGLPAADALMPQAADYFEGLMEGFVAYDASWRMTYMNAAAERMLSRQRADVLGKTWQEAFPHAVGNPIDLMYQRVKSKRLPERLELFYAHYGRWMEVSASPVRGGGVAVYFRDVTDRRQAQMALRESEERLRQATEAGQLVVWDVDLRTNFVKCAGRAQAVFGMDEGPGEAFFERIHPEDRALARAAARAVITGERAYSVEYRVVTPAGETRWLHGRGDVLRDQQGRGVRFVGVTADVTERKQVEHALRASEERLRKIIETNAVGLLLGDFEGRILEVNDAFLGMVGYTREDFYQGRINWIEITPSEYRNRDAAAMEQMRRSGRHEPYEKEYVRGDGSRVPVLVATAYLPDETLGVGFIVDLTQQKGAELALRRSEERLRSLVVATSQMVWTADSEGRVMEDSPSWRAFTGQSHEQWRGWGWLEAIHPDDRERTMQIWRQSVAQRQICQLEYRVRTAGGAYRWTAVRAVPVVEADGRIREWIGTNTDITERRLAEEALRESEQLLKEADRRKNEFLATLAHELRNPLAPIRNAVQILNLQGPADPTLQSARDIIDRQVQHMVRLIDDLLDVSRITQGKLTLRTERVSLASVVQHALDTSRPHLSHQMTVSLPAEPVYLDADPFRLAQVFSNLLNNACKYTEKGGRISLTAERDGGDVVVKVSDSGIGISTEHLSRLFEMFSQIESTLERAQGGLGVGLALARGLVEMHGGRIEARSVGIGKGSEFVVRLPAAATPRAAQQGAAKSDRSNPDAPRRVLVVEDNMDAAASLAMLLRLDGHEVETAHDGLAALRKAEGYKPDVVLLDIGLPKLNGYDTCRALRAQPWGSAVLVVALSGWGQEEDRRKSKEAGFDGHLVKPVDHAALMAALASWRPMQR